MELTNLKKEKVRAGAGALPESAPGERARQVVGSERNKEWNDALDRRSAQNSSQPVSKQTPQGARQNAQPVRILTWAALFKSPTFYSVIFAILILFGGVGYTLYVYAVDMRAGFERPIVWYCSVWLLALLARGYSVKTLLCKAFKGEIKEKPFDRNPDPRPRCFEWRLNGKYYLMVTYWVEYLEVAYQLLNYQIYSCSLPANCLVPYTAVIAAESVARSVFRKNYKDAINSADKSRDMLIDLLVDVFVLIYPLLAMRLVAKIDFKEEELIQMTVFPLMCLMRRISITFRAEIIQLLYRIELEERDRGQADQTPQGRRRRRSTRFNTDQKDVVQAQNEVCSEMWRLALKVATDLQSVFFVLLTIFQIVNSALVSEPLHYKNYCLVNAPMCTNWFSYEDNCVSVALWKTNIEEKTDGTLKLFDTCTATQRVAWSGLGHGSTLDGKFPRLRSLELYKTNATVLPPFQQWADFTILRITHAPRLKTVELTPHIRTLYVYHAPNLVFKKLILPKAIDLRLGGIGPLPSEIKAGKVSVLALTEMNLEVLPEEFQDREYRQLFVSGNNLTSLNGAWASFIFDGRYNKLTKYESALPKYPYGYGNRPSCPEGFICEPFCNRKCSNKWYAKNDIIENRFCVVECKDLDGCGVSEACKKQFED